MCTRELTAYYNDEGGRPLFGFEGIKKGLPIVKLPCGKCPECQKDYYSMWATRGSRELMQWDSSLFITLTYDEENLPSDHSLNKKHVQDFIKRVKERFSSTKENPIRQIYCGEYGSTTLRPHYHVVLFNLDFTDKVPHYKSAQGHQVFRSATLDELWKKGHAEFGYATPSSIAYIFKYILKKKTRKEKREPLIIQLPSGDYEVEHEFIEASRNPGIGAIGRDSPSNKKGFLAVGNFKAKLPKYYLEHIKKHDPRLYEKIKDSKFDFFSSQPKESELRKKQKEIAQKKLTDSKKRM